MRQLRPSEHSSRSIYHLLTSVVVPRPIAWVSTLSKDGVPNLAPFSYFSAITSKPPLLSIAVGRRRGERKDTARNASRTRELVVNVVTEKSLDPMVASSSEVGPEVNEFTLAGVESVESVLIKPPRVKSAPIQMECRTHQIIEISPGIVDLVIAEVVLFHIDEELPLDENLHIPAEAIRPLARLGGNAYGTLGEIHQRKRPAK